MSYKAESTISQGCELMVCIKLLITRVAFLWISLHTFLPQVEGVKRAK